jgi:hypothetical protein
MEEKGAEKVYREVCAVSIELGHGDSSTTSRAETGEIIIICRREHFSII